MTELNKTDIDYTASQDTCIKSRQNYTAPTSTPDDLDELWDKYSDVSGGYETVDWDSLKQAILANYISKQELAEALEDDYITKYSGNSRFDQQVLNEITGANKLRAKLRNQLLDGKEK